MKLSNGDVISTGDVEDGLDTAFPAASVMLIEVFPCGVVSACTL